MGLQIHDLNLSLQGKPILHNLSFSVADGELVALLGASGEGKSTTLKAIAGLLVQDSGTVTIDGICVDGMPAYKRDISIVFQDVRLFPNMTVLGNVAYPLRMRGMAKRERLDRARELLALVQLDGLGDRRIDQISGGQQQRAALARALAASPHVLLLDEPFSGLDESLREEMRELVLDVHRKLSTTTVLVTHDATEALSMADRIAYLAGGTVVQFDTPAMLFSRPATVQVATCFGDCATLAGTLSGDGTLALGSLALDLPAGTGALPAPGPCTAIIRRSAVHPATGKGFPAGSATVLRSLFRGDAYRILLDTGDGCLEAEGAAPLPVGSRVDVGIDPEGVHVFPQVAGSGNGTPA